MRDSDQDIYWSNYDFNIDHACIDEDTKKKNIYVKGVDMWMILIPTSDEVSIWCKLWWYEHNLNMLSASYSLFKLESSQQLNFRKMCFQVQYFIS